jgi:hypothetical protein
VIYSLDQLVQKILYRLRIWVRWRSTPYESQLEQDLVRHLRSFCGHIRWYTQLEVKTLITTFYLDVAGLVRPGRAVAFEVDGTGYHRDLIRDFCRDALILGTGRIAAICRVRACDVEHRPIELLYLLGLRETDLLKDTAKLLCKAYVASHDHTETVSGVLIPMPKLRVTYGTVDLPGVKEFLEFARKNRDMRFRELVAAVMDEQAEILFAFIRGTDGM